MPSLCQAPRKSCKHEHEREYLAFLDGAARQVVRAGSIFPFSRTVSFQDWVHSGCR